MKAGEEKIWTRHCIKCGKRVYCNWSVNGHTICPTTQSIPICCDLGLRFNVLYESEHLDPQCIDCCRNHDKTKTEKIQNNKDINLLKKAVSDFESSIEQRFEHVKRTILSSLIENIKAGNMHLYITSEIGIFGVDRFENWASTIDCTIEKTFATRTSKDYRITFLNSGGKKK